jgi:prepilin-type N-terminal cleavage/methylation domain-containing protein
MKTRKGLTLIEVLVVIAIAVILLWIFYDFLKVPKQREEPDLTGKVTELKLPQDFAGTEMPVPAPDGGYLLVTYTDENGEYRTQRYGPYNWSPPKRIHWIKPERLGEKQE